MLSFDFFHYIDRHRCRWLNSLPGNWGVHRHYLLFEIRPMLDLKRSPQPPHDRVEVIMGWRALSFLWALFVYSTCFLMFSKVVFIVDFSSLIGSFGNFRLLIDRIDLCTQQDVFQLILESTTRGAA